MLIRHSNDKLIRLADPGPSGTWPGQDFGYLVPEPGTLPTDSMLPVAGQEIGKAMGTDRPLVCVRQNGVDLLPGNTNSAKDGINTRFGLYPSSLQRRVPKRVSSRPERQEGDEAAGRAAAGVPPPPTARMTSGSPNWPPGNTPIHAFPRTPALLEAPVALRRANIGASTWDCAAYWDGQSHRA